MTTLALEKRITSTLELKKARKENYIPAIVYGSDKDPVVVKVTKREFKNFLDLENKNTIIEIDIEGSKEKVLVKSYQFHPIRQNDILNIDFLRVEDSHKVIVNVSIKHEGSPFGIRNQGSQFKIMKRFVKIKCKPNDIPESFIEDVTEMRSEEIFYTRDLKFEQGSILTPPKTALFGLTKGRLE